MPEKKYYICLSAIIYMKQITIVFLLLTYLLPSIGITIVKHYCGGELSSTQLLCFADHECGCGDKQMKADCCHDESTIIKIDDEQSQQVESSNEKQFNIQGEFFQAFGYKYLCQNIDGEINYILHPPDDPKSRLYIFNKVFRI